MHIRRPLAVSVVGLALICGGALTGCASPVGSTTGTPMDDAAIPSGNEPGAPRHGNLPYFGERVTSIPGAGRAGGNAVGVP